MTNTDPEKSVRRIKLTGSLIIEPEYIYLSSEEIHMMLNSMGDKISIRKNLTQFEELEFVIIPVFAPDNEKEEITREISQLFADYCEYSDWNVLFQSKIILVLGWMIDRNISDDGKKEELWDVIGLEKGRDSFQECLDELRQEDKKIINEQTVELKQKDIVISRQGYQEKMTNYHLKKMNYLLRRMNYLLKMM